MLYNTGTIAINGNTATGTGTNWTAPANQIRAGQTILVLSSPVQVFQISSVDSATSLTVTPAASPALSGQKYAIMVSDIISVDGLAQAMSQLIKEYDENIGAWETFATTNSNQNITVTINGTSLSIPAIGKLLQKGSNGALPVNQGGTGATKVEDVRTNLGLGDSATRNVGMAAGTVAAGNDSRFDKIASLGSSATKDVGTAAGNVMQVGAFGLGSSSAQVISDVWDKSLGSRFIMMSPSTSGGPKFYSMGIRISERNYGNGPNDVSQQSFSAFSMGGKRFAWMTMADGIDSGWLEVYHNGNTTKSSDGTLKAASPVIKLFSDGRYLTNDESEGCTVTRLATGEYLVEGCEGLNSDAAWGGIDGGFDIPTDRNKQPLIWLDYEVYADGSLLVKTFHRTHPAAPEFARNELLGVNDGDPVDIPRDQFVSIRVEMPADSIWNQRQKDTTRVPVKE
ncbi:phage tail protein [Enterobacter asburiae]|uniref:Phage tail protein n=2 Tax=Enterobacter cloacae complex TaxID=354276 RepID=A0A7W3DF45_ENTAS|nr:phage tail protein [Enterobacter asburiae]MBA7987407.1 phage tail protein [Enterobacter asburiae]MBA8077602.1 phage tail protein [Enterobacter asburiae]